MSAHWRNYALHKHHVCLLRSFTLRSSATGPHPSPPPLRQGREILYMVTGFRCSLPCRSGGGLGWGPVQKSGGYQAIYCHPQCGHPYVHNFVVLYPTLLVYEVVQCPVKLLQFISPVGMPTIITPPGTGRALPSGSCSKRRGRSFPVITSRWCRVGGILMRATRNGPRVRSIWQPTMASPRFFLIGIGIPACGSWRRRWSRGFCARRIAGG